MKSALLIHGIIELLGAIVCSFYPEIIFSETPMIVTRIYGLAAGVIGIMSLLCYRHYEPTPLFRQLIVVMMFFHGTLAMLCSKADLDIVPSRTGAMAVHLVLFIIFLLGYMKDLKPDKIS